MRHQLVSLGPEFLSNFQLEYFVCLLLKTTKNFSWSPKSAVRSASREEGLELSDTSCATGQKADDLLATVSLNSMISNVLVVPKLCTFG